MKKILIISSLFVFLLAGCAKNKDEAPTETAVETQTEIQSESQLPAVPEYDLKAIGDELNQKYTGNDQYPGTAIEFQMNSAVNEVNFGLTVKEDTSPETAADYAETILKAFNDLIAGQDPEIQKSGQDSYGGFYNNYVASVKVTPEGKKSDPSFWLVDAIIDSAEDNKILPITGADNSVKSEVEGDNKKNQETQVSEEDEMGKDEDQDVQHGPGTIPTEPATFESKPE